MASRLGDRSLENPAQNIHVHLGFKIVSADFLKKTGPLIGKKIQIVNLIILAEKSAVISGNTGLHVAFVDGAKKLDEILPAGIGDIVEPRKLVGRFVQRGLRQQLPALAEGDENDSVHQLLSDVNGLVGRFLFRVDQMFDEFKPILVVMVV